MQYEVNTPEEYLEALDKDWRKTTLLKLRELILAQDDTFKEIIEYKMLGFSLNGHTIFHLNAQRQYVSLYVGDIKKADPHRRLLNGLNTGKGCIRFSKSIQIEETNIKEFITKISGLANEGKDISC